MALFGQGRLLYQRGDDKGALRAYQRASQWDPDSIAILKEIVALAFAARHQSSAVRYAVRLELRAPSDPRLMRELALYITPDGDFERAAQLYDSAIRLATEIKEQRLVAQLHADNARLAFMQDDFQRGAKSANYVLKALDDPNEYGLDSATRKKILGDPEITYSILAELLLETGQFAKAEEIHRRSFKSASSPSPGLLAFHLAKIRHKQGRTTEAFREMQTYFDARETSAGGSAYELLEQLWKSKETDSQRVRKQFLAQLENLCQTDPENQPLGLYLAADYLRQKKPQHAQSILERFHEQDSEFRTYEGLATAYRTQNLIGSLLALVGRTYEKLGDLFVLGSELETIVADEQLMQQLIQEGEARIGQKKRKMLPSESMGLAFLCLEADRPEPGSQFFEYAFNEANTEEEKVNFGTDFGLSCLAADHGSRAAAALQKAITLTAGPAELAELRFYLATALELQGKTDEALTMSDKVGSEFPNPIALMARRAWILLHAKRTADAETAYEELIRKFDQDHSSDDIRAELQSARMLLSNLCLQRGDHDAAEEWLAQVLDEFPDDAGAMNDLGYLWADRNQNLFRALRMIEAAVKAEPENTAYRDSLGWVYFRMERIDDALRELRRAVDVAEPDPVILDHLGDVLAANQQQRAALATWKRAVAAFDTSEEKDKIETVKAKIERLETEP